MPAAWPPLGAFDGALVDGNLLSQGRGFRRPAPISWGNDVLEAFLKLLAGERPREVVWTADIVYWIAGRQQDGTAKPAWKTEEGCLQLHKELGILPYYYYEKFWAAEPRYDPSVQLIETKAGGATNRRFRTPVGELCETNVYSPRSCSWGVTKHFVESQSDLDVLLHLMQHRRLEPANLADWPERRRLWQTYGGLPIIGLPRSPLASFMVEWAGVQNASYLLLDAPQQIAEILRLMEEQEPRDRRRVRLGAAAGPLSATTCRASARTGLYDNYMSPGHRRRIEQLHAADVKCAVHLDGAIKGLLPKLVRAGFDAIEALTPKPAGDLDIEEIRDLAAERHGNPLGRRARHHVRAPLHLGPNGGPRPTTLGLLAGSAFRHGRGRPGAARRQHRVLPQNRPAHFIVTCHIRRRRCHCASERI